MFFCFLDKMMDKELWKTKKIKVFLGFWVFVALVSFWLRNEKPKNLEFFGFSHFFNHHFIQKTKNLEFFVFSRSRQKKNKKPRQNKKKETWASDQTFSEKFWFFGFLVFSRFWLFCIS